METEVQYIGDGVYARIDENGWVTLTTGNHDISLADNAVHLEPAVILELMEFLERVRVIREEAKDE